MQRLKKLSAGLDTDPPHMQLNNRWGRFTITAYYMKPPISRRHEPLINFRVKQSVPSHLVLINQLDNFELTPRQKDICLQIGMDKSYEDISRDLGIALSTVVSHKKDIFARLEINSRRELASHILENSAI